MTGRLRPWLVKDRLQCSTRAVPKSFNVISQPGRAVGFLGCLLTVSLIRQIDAVGVQPT